MAQVTIYLPNDLEATVKATAKSLNLSISKFIASLLEEKVQNEWGSDVHKLSGAWDDFSPLDEIRTAQGQDAPREAF